MKKGNKGHTYNISSKFEQFVIMNFFAIAAFRIYEMNFSDSEFIDSSLIFIIVSYLYFNFYKVSQKCVFMILFGSFILSVIFHFLEYGDTAKILQSYVWYGLMIWIVTQLIIYRSKQ